MAPLGIFYIPDRTKIKHFHINDLELQRNDSYDDAEDNSDGDDDDDDDNDDDDNDDDADDDDLCQQGWGTSLGTTRLAGGGQGMAGGHLEDCDDDQEDDDEYYKDYHDGGDNEDGDGYCNGFDDTGLVIIGMITQGSKTSTYDPDGSPEKTVQGQF